MRDEIIKKNLIITITSLLLFFLFSFFATSYSIRNTFENEVVSVSQMVENQLESNDNDTEVINSFTYNQSWMKIIYATNTGLIMIDSENDNVELASRIQEDKLALLNNIEVKDTTPLGALPGTTFDKLLPYVGPLADHVGGMEGIEDLMQRGQLEVQHLGFIRGRDIKNSIKLFSNG